MRRARAERHLSPRLSCVRVSLSISGLGIWTKPPPRQLRSLGIGFVLQKRASGQTRRTRAAAKGARASGLLCLESSTYYNVLYFKLRSLSFDGILNPDPNTCHQAVPREGT